MHFLEWYVWIPIEISLTFVPMGSINNNPALFQIIAWRRPGDKPLSEPMMVSSLTHICVARPQWVNARVITPLLIHWSYIFFIKTFVMFLCVHGSPPGLTALQTKEARNWWFQISFVFFLQISFYWINPMFIEPIPQIPVCVYHQDCCNWWGQLNAKYNGELIRVYSDKHVNIYLDTWHY